MKENNHNNNIGIELYNGHKNREEKEKGKKNNKYKKNFMQINQEEKKQDFNLNDGKIKEKIKKTKNPIFRIFNSI